MKKNTTIAVIAFIVLFVEHSCGSVESVKDIIDHHPCKCLNGTADNGLIKCNCDDIRLTEVPNDLPLPLHEL